MRAKKNRPKIPNVVCISDTHIGCKLALMSPAGAVLDEGNTVLPSAFQLRMWEHWRYFWDEWVPMATHGEPFAVVHNGDAIDGVHHQGTTQWSQCLADQRTHAELILGPVVAACEGRYYHIRGTEAHVGKSATEEEQLAKSLGAVRSRDGHYARWDLWKTFGDHLLNFSHHIGTTSSAQAETTALTGELASAFTEAGQWGHRPPSVIVRSHRHRQSEIRLPASWGYATVLVTPAWQGKTPYVHRLKQGRTGTPQVGGSLIRIGDEELHTRHRVCDLGRSDPE